MTHIKSESFDAITNTNYSTRWNTTSTGSLDTTNQRTGRACWSTTSGTLKHVFPSADAHHTFIVGAAVWRQAVSTANAEIYLFGDNGAIQHVSLIMDGNGGGTIRRGANNGTILATIPAGTFPQATWYYVELKARISDTVGTIELRKNGDTTPIINLTGLDTKNGGTNVTFDGITFTLTGSGSPTIKYDDIYIANGAGTVNNDFYGDTEIHALMPIADGPVAQWVPSSAVAHYTLVNEIPATSTGNVSATPDGDRELFQFTALTNTTGVVKAVTSMPQVAKVGTDAKYVRDTVRIGATDYDGPSQVLGTGYVYLPTIRETSPATAVAWTAAEINAARFGLVGKDS